MLELSITKSHRLSGLHSRHLFSHSSGGFRSEITVLSGLVSGETFLPGVQTAAFPLCPHAVFPLCVCERELSGVSSFSYKDIGPVELGLPP